MGVVMCSFVLVTLSGIFGTVPRSSAGFCPSADSTSASAMNRIPARCDAAREGSSRSRLLLGPILPDAATTALLVLP